MEIEYIQEKYTPDTCGRKYASIIEEWLRTSNKTLKITCKSAREKVNVASALANYRKSHNLDYTIYREQRTYNVYAVRS